MFNIDKLHHCGGVEGAYIHVHHHHETQMLHIVKVACSKAITKFCFELFCRFSDVEIKVTLSMVYPQYWLCEKTITKNFQVHLN